MSDIAALQERLVDGGLDAAVLTSYQTVSPFARTDIVSQRLHDRPVCFLVPASGPTTLLVCVIEEEEVRVTTVADDVRTYVEFAESPVDVLVGLLRERRLEAARVGFELGRWASLHVDALRSQLPGLSVLPADELLDAAVAVKTAEEIGLLGTIGRYAQRAVDRAIGSLRAGMTERECCPAFMWELVQTGGRPEHMVFGSGEQTLQGHPAADDRLLREGVLWRMDLGARYAGGYLSDLARTGVVGDPVPAQEEAMAHVLSAQRAAIEAVEPGRPAKDLWYAAERVLEPLGLSVWAPHLGHGIGIGLHELPALAPSEDTPLVAGTVLNIEPIVAVPSRREAYHVEDLVLVTDEGFELLTQPPRELLRIAG
jgi:Xaa-Pro aminopeptidase